jgi:hypothetical protein
VKSQSRGVGEFAVRTVEQESAEARVAAQEIERRRQPRVDTEMASGWSANHSPRRSCSVIASGALHWTTHGPSGSARSSRRPSGDETATRAGLTPEPLSTVVNARRATTRPGPGVGDRQTNGRGT